MRDLSFLQSNFCLRIVEKERDASFCGSQRLALILISKLEILLQAEKGNYLKNWKESKKRRKRKVIFLVGGEVEQDLKS